MIFKICRASEDFSKSPCPEAYQNADGTWAIKIDTLEQMMEFIARVGECIVDEDSITIHDDWLY